VVIWRPSSQRKKEREKKKFCVLWAAKEILFFQKREKTFDWMDKKERQKKSRKREKHRNR
jgi:hypothetical protein